MNTKLKSDTGSTFSGLYKTLDPLTDQMINTVPFEGSWTAGQVVEHIIKSASGLPQVCGGPTEAVGRKEDEKLAAIRNLFLDFSVKFQSPDFILPGNGPYHKAELRATLEKIEQDINHINATQDLSPECLDFELPGFGRLTRHELLGFVLIHAQRHTRQLENIAGHLTP
jgi:hypothetical protein